MNYPAPVACALCMHETIGTHPGGVCRVCNQHRQVNTIVDGFTTVTVHGQCTECHVCASNAITYAQVTGSTIGAYRTAPHGAIAMRKAVA